MIKKLFKTRKELRNWLVKNHDKETEVWLIFYKAKVKKESIKYEDAVEEALCFGWIDSKVKRIDDEKHMQRYTPRKAKSNWAASNKARVKRLIKNGLMTEFGLNSIKIAQQNGSWNKLDNIEARLEIPEELKVVFKANQKAKGLFDELSRSRKKQIIWWIESAKRNNTKVKRVNEAINLLFENTDE